MKNMKHGSQVLSWNCQKQAQNEPIMSLTQQRQKLRGVKWLFSI